MANSDCIYREAAIEAIKLECAGCAGQEIGERFCSKCAIRQREVALYSVPAADVVARDCFNRILAENDTMREQLASIGKKPGDKMDDVRRVVRGEWVPYPVLDDMYDAFFKCSVCGTVTSVPHRENIKERKPFCECGAEMKVEDNT